ncbi:hypothetical protein GIB67_014203 [Kingdonia uniflora]|uniref:Uncharacterized protein n=1 Tax=Kingdonia uniflora TaxID=39325 RepID=A0A7J7M1W2_9MAGN|nr:hypothetical protein GIB67_014203 [Kingdonia uniflora]
MGGFMRDMRNAGINPVKPTPLSAVRREKETIFPVPRRQNFESNEKGEETLVSNTFNAMNFEVASIDKFADPHDEDEELHGSLQTKLKLPHEMGVNLPNLEGLYMAQNYLYGPIPNSLGNALRIQALDLSFKWISRPTTPIYWWEGCKILGGRDEFAGGTWLACTRDGRLAFLTNVMESPPFPEAKSRGDIPVRFLKVNFDPEQYIMNQCRGPTSKLSWRLYLDRA